MVRGVLSDHVFRSCVVLLISGASVSSNGLHVRAQTVDQFNCWTSLAIRAPLSPRWGLFSETFWRRNDGFKNPMQFKSGISAEYGIGHGCRISLGYAYWLNHPYGAFPTLATQPEHRIWQQADIQQGIPDSKAFKVEHRIRLEQRFIERFTAGEDGPVPQGFKYVGRLRWQAQLRWVLKKDGTGERFALVPFFEAIIRFGDPTFEGLFDQFRLGLFGDLPLMKAVRFRTGYLFQDLVRADASKVEHNHTLTFGIAWTLPQKAADTE